MTLKKLDFDFSVCKVSSLSCEEIGKDFFFTAKTDEEFSVVCITSDVPHRTLAREDGWRAFRIEGVLDFSLIGILSRISSVLAENNIGIFAVSTFNTDYIFTKKENFVRALGLLEAAGFEIA